MNVEIKITKPIPKNQIEKFEDKVVYNTAVLTREYTKSRNTYPYRTGKLRASEVSAPIVGSNKEYGLSAGVNYAKYVYKMTNVKWTNPSTVNHWYYNNFKSKGAGIVSNAVVRSMKGL